MMKLVIFLAVLGLAVALPQGNRPRPQARPAPPPGAITRTADIVNLRSEFENTGDGNYHYSYENSDGTSVAQKGALKAPLPGEEDPILAVEGFYKFYAPEGELTEINYSADERGYIATGDAIPTSPPIPEAILKSIQINLAAAAQQKNAQVQNQQRGRF